METNTKLKIIFLAGEKVIFYKNDRKIDDIFFIESSFIALKKIIEETDAKIIITSSLRKINGCKRLLEMKLKEYDIDKALIGYTAETFGKKRRDKIKEKISSFNDMIDSFVIFDSRTDLGKELSNNLISCFNGIDEARVIRSIGMLNK